jgi:hypothetical protein
MVSAPPLLSFLLMIVSGWAHRHQLIVIEFLQAEDQFLKRQVRGKLDRAVESRTTDLLITMTR